MSILVILNIILRTLRRVELFIDPN